MPATILQFLSFSLLLDNTSIQKYNFLSVLYVCETWCLAVRAEHKLRMFENRVLRKIFGPNRDEVREEWKKLSNEDLLYQYISPNTI